MEIRPLKGALHCLAVITLGAQSNAQAGASAGLDESIAAPAAHTQAPEHGRSVRHRRIRGLAVTGVNSILGKPFFNWGPPFGLANYPTLFEYNEGGGTPFEITEHTPDSAILASGVSPRFLLAAGKEIRPEWINVPLRAVPVLTDFLNVERQALPNLLEAEPLELAQSEPAGPITLGQWMKAEGDLRIACSGRGASVRLRLRHLIPLRIYSVWATMALPSEVPKPGEIRTTSLPLPVGGTPNVFVTDAAGDATYERRIRFCPLDTRSPDVPPMLTMEVMLHANHQTYGAIPSAGMVPGEWQGVIQFSHVVFPVNVELLGAE